MDAAHIQIVRQILDQNVPIRNLCFTLVHATYSEKNLIIYSDYAW